MSKFTPSTVISGRYGYVVSPGYLQFDNFRIYEDTVVVGPYGEPVVVKGKITNADGSPVSTSGRGGSSDG